MVNICQNHLQELVGENGAAISKAKEGVICEYCGERHGAGVKDPLMAESTEGPVTMHDADMLSNEDLSQHRESYDQRWQGDLVVEGLHGEVIHLQGVGKGQHLP